MIYEPNIKISDLENNKLSCVCGSIRYDIKMYQGDDDDYNWIMVKCKKCGNLLYYNGA